jgi:hypothetical protein
MNISRSEKKLLLETRIKHVSDYHVKSFFVRKVDADEIRLRIDSVLEVLREIGDNG